MIQTLYLSKDLRIRGYFSMQKGVPEKKISGIRCYSEN